MKRFFAVVLSSGLGIASVVAVWFTSAWYEEGGMWPRRPEVFIPLVAISLLLCSVGAFASRAARGSRNIAVIAFATPFALPAAISSLAIREEIYRPFVFWGSVALFAFLAAFGIHAFVFRARTPKVKTA